MIVKKIDNEVLENTSLGDLECIIDEIEGMREFQVWLDEGELDSKFQDIKDLESQCKFRDCSHRKEPGCAIRKAIGDGTLTKERFISYIRLKMEVDYLSGRKNQRDKTLTKRQTLVEKIKRNH